MTEPTYREIDAKTVSRGSGLVDPWFLGRYGMNLYRGCEHACAYCDGRAEKYRVDGSFDHDIVVKRNALAILARELVRLREPGFLFVGGGVSDAYQPAERKYELARGALAIALDRHLPVHVLTKSALVERDFDVLVDIQRARGAILSFSIQTVDDSIRERFEPGAIPIAERFRLLERAKLRGLATGVMAMPVLPGISDQPHAVDALFARASDAGVDFVLAGGLTLRPGVQMDSYLRVVREHDASLLDGYQKLYRARRASGTGDSRYYDRLERRFHEASVRHGLPGRIPRALFQGRVPLYTEIAVLLEHEEFMAGRLDRPRRGLGAAGWAIQKWAKNRFARDARRRVLDAAAVEREFTSMLDDGTLTAIPGVHQAALTAARALASVRA